MKESERKCWRQFCSYLNRNTPNAQVWKNVEKLQNDPSPSFPVIEGDRSREFFSKLTPDSTYEPPIKHPPYETNDPLCKPFVISELNRALKHNSNTAPVIDNFQYSMLFNLPSKAKMILLEIFNNILRTGIFPEDWKTYVVVPILKPHKNPKEASSYRPISLSSCVAKTFERMLNLRLIW